MTRWGQREGYGCSCVSAMMGCPRELSVEIRYLEEITNVMKGHPCLVLFEAKIVEVVRGC